MDLAEANQILEQALGKIPASYLNKYNYVILSSVKDIMRDILKPYREQKDLQYRRAAQRREHRKKEIEPKIIAWANENLKPGDTIKLAGTRDKGYRKVIKVANNHVTGWQIKARLRFDGALGHQYVAKILDSTTTNHLSKIREVNGKKIRELI